MTIRSLSIAFCASAFSLFALTANATDSTAHTRNHTAKCWESQRGDPSLPAEKLAVPCKPGQHGEVKSEIAVSNTEPAQRGDANLPAEHLPKTAK